MFSLLHLHQVFPMRGTAKGLDPTTLFYIIQKHLFPLALPIMSRADKRAYSKCHFKHYSNGQAEDVLVKHCSAALRDETVLVRERSELYSVASWISMSIQIIVAPLKLNDSCRQKEHFYIQMFLKLHMLLNISLTIDRNKEWQCYWHLEWISAVIELNTMLIDTTILRILAVLYTSV